MLASLLTLGCLACSAPPPGDPTTPTDTIEDGAGEDATGEDAAGEDATGEDADGEDAISVSDSTSDDALSDVEAIDDADIAPDDDALEPSDADAPGDTADTAPRDPDAEVSPGECPPTALCDLAAPIPPCTEGRCNALGACVPTPILGCCRSDADCALLPPEEPCDVWRCDLGQCAQVRYPNCCSSDGDCAQDMIAGACGPSTGLCAHCPTEATCATPGVPWLEASFSGPSLASAGFVVLDDQPADRVTWSISPSRYASPPSSAYLGDPICRTYFTGALDAACEPVAPMGHDAGRVSAALLSPVLALTHGSAPPIATFWLWSDVEPLLGVAHEPDVLRVAVVPLDGSPEWLVASSLDVGKSTLGAWRPFALDLSPWRGRFVRLRFAFDTLDGLENLHEGVYLDELRVFPGCEAGGCCETDADCDPAAAPDACARVACVGLTSGANRFCAVIPREPGAACTPCTDDPSCDDDNPCTVDTCAPDGRCQHDAFCCLRATLFREDFDEGLGSWTVTGPPPGASGSAAWQVSDHATSGPLSAWFGVAETGTYDTGARAFGSLTSLPIALPSNAEGVELTFALYLETEWDGSAYLNPLGLDRLTLEIVTNTSATLAWSSDVIGGSTEGAWLTVAAPLGAFGGQTVRLRFTFDTVDGDRNDFAGPFLDALTLGTTCPAQGSE